MLPKSIAVRRGVGTELACALARLDNPYILVSDLEAVTSAERYVAQHPHFHHTHFNASHGDQLGQRLAPLPSWLMCVNAVVRLRPN